ncbi:MAG TPA: glycosyltransferase family 2 protein [Candidatus Competibacter sp.]|nr:glycosyltransferase family 2 protein [Candidatus Competibacter sp.]
MLKGKKIIVVMPAYNAARTLEKTYTEIPRDIVDEIILVDDNSQDNTADVAHNLGINHVIVHDINLGYGGNQKTCYRTALALGADIVLMIHPDYQYTPKLCAAMSWLIAEDVFDCVLGSRILGVGALKGGMPIYKFIANRILTLFQNLLLPYKLSEYHTGYRAFSRKVLESLSLDHNDNDFIFDNQMLLQIIHAGFRIGEITCPTLYMEDSSSINLRRSIRYGLGVISNTLLYRLHQWKLYQNPLLNRINKIN